MNVFYKVPALLLVAVSLVIAACNSKGPASLGEAKSVEVQMQKYDLSVTTPQVDKSVSYTAPGLPTDLEWQTSQAVSYGSAKAVRGGTYFVRLGDFPPSLETVGPHGGGTAATITDGLDMYLVGFDPNTDNPIPEIADHWAVDAKTNSVYFHIDPAAKWDDGVAITSDDFNMWLKLRRSPDIQSPYWNDLASEKYYSFKKYSDSIFKLTNNAGGLPAELLRSLNFQPVPTHAFPNGEVPKTYLADYLWKFLPVSGPYKVSDKRDGQYIQLQRVANWWGDSKARFAHMYNYDTVMWVVVRDQATVFNYFLDGQLYDYFPTALEWHTKMDAPQINKGYINRYISYYEPDVLFSWGVWMNLDYAPLKNPLVRKGIAQSLNYGKVNDVVNYGEYIVQKQLGLYHKRYGENYDAADARFPDYSVDGAIESFKAAGYSKIGPDGIRVDDKGQRLSFELVYGNESATAALTILVEEAKKTGLEIVLKPLQPADAWHYYRNNKHQIAWTTAGGFDMQNYWHYFHGVNAHLDEHSNYTNMDNPELNKLIDAGLKATDPKLQAELSRKIQKIIADSNAYIPSTYVPFTRYAVWAFIKTPEGLQIFKNGSGLIHPYSGYAWIDPEEYKKVMAAKKSEAAYQAPMIYTDTTFKPQEAK